MGRFFTLHALLICMLLGTQMAGQTIWPGDINNNGQVNGIDVLYWGMANGRTGAPRSSSSANWQPQPMPSAWAMNFPGGINYAYADANGDGVINNMDLASALDAHFGKTHGILQPDTYSPTQTNTTPLQITALSQTVDAGTRVDINVALGNTRFRINRFYGVTFTISYDPTMVSNGAVVFEKATNFWPDPQGNNSQIFVKRDHANGKLTFVITRTNQVTTSGEGLLGKFGLVLMNPTSSNKSLKLKLEQVKIIDNAMETLPLSLIETEVIVKPGTVSGGGSGNGGGGTVGPCPDVTAPVCGKDGKVYKNSCYAEAAGVTTYTEGTCFSGCVNPTQMNPNATCGAVYEPVCGCNGITYSNACEATKAGVVSFTAGPCGNNSNCYDPNYVVTNGFAVLNPITRVITTTCPQVSEPVCGCNGITYTNACTAEANGIRSYTRGSCASSCINPAQINPNANIPNVYQPVCGCNGQTYTNAAAAAAAGVTSTTPGPCGTASAWCNKAVPLDCGNFLPHESTADAGNNINNYPCSNKSYPGPERVYVINKTTAGDLQVGLEIITPGLDLDIFLLAANCGQLTCLKSSTTNNSQTNNEGLVLENAPVGTYYLIVDGPSAGQYRLEVNCGYLDCRDAVQLTCGQTYYGSNLNGNDNVSLYGCGNIYNVENNGPEIVHTFTITQAGQVTINLTGLSANLELFLLRSCNRGDCINFSESPGNSNEQISVFLQPGTYYVVVDGYNGATSNYALTVNCISSCNINSTLEATAASCGLNNGSIKVTVNNGSPGYLVSYTGPKSGTFVTNANMFHIANLPAGVYTITVTDCKNCKVTKTITVGSQGNLNATATASNASCSQTGSIHVNIQNGTPSYKIYVSGPVNQVYMTSNSNYTIPNLPPGTYHLYIVDANGCTVSRSVTINQGAGNFYFTATPNAAACETPGSISIKTFNGKAPYKIKVMGPKSGTATSNAHNFNIVQLPPGTYTITIEDANWCTFTVVVTVPSSGLEANITANASSCGASGSVQVHVTSGTPGFMISWTGPVTGNTTSNNFNTTIQNLPGGTYTFTVKDANWCVLTKTVHVPSGTGGFNVVLVPTNGNCESPGKIGVDIIGGTKPYTITWSGPQSGSATTNNNWFDIVNLPAGTYTVTVKDKNNCTVSKTTHIITSEGNLHAALTATGGDCTNPNGSIKVTISGGTAPFKVSWLGPTSGNANTNSNVFNINNLPPGSYTVTVTDANWCMVTKTIHVPAGTGGFNVVLVPTNANCESPGKIGVDIIGGTKPYTITWSGPQSGSATTNNNWFDIVNLPAGTYTVTVKDKNNCTVSKTTTIIGSQGNLHATLTATGGTCTHPNGSITVTISGGKAPFKIAWTGPVSGNSNTNSTSFTINNLPPGSYTVTVTDADWCMVTKTIHVPGGTGGFDVVLVPYTGNCESPGKIRVEINGGTKPYTITWSGPQSGTATTNNNVFDINNLPAGNYTVTVKDKNNCTVTRSTHVISTEGNLHATLTTTGGACGSSTGSIAVSISGGRAPFKISWTGPVSGNANTNAFTFTINNLPPGNYTVTVTDADWCMVTKTIHVPAGTGGFNVVLVPTNGNCESPGKIGVDIIGGTKPYTITWSGPQSGTASTNGNWFDIVNLVAGTYTVTVKDKNNCTVSKTTHIISTQGNLHATLTATGGTCTSSNGSVTVNISGGRAPFKISWTGPVSGNANTNSNVFNINNLPPGNYTVTVTDADWCMVTKTIHVPAGTGGFNVVLVPTNGNCESPGKIGVDIIGGTKPYTITWSGPQSGSATTNNNWFDIVNLVAGTYTVTVKDKNNCTVSKTTHIISTQGNLHATLTATGGTCTSSNGSVTVNISGGRAPFKISWTGPVSGNANTNSNVFNINNLPPGNYTISVTDADWCMVTKTIHVPAGTGGFNVTLQPNNGVCEANGVIGVDIQGGTKPYLITWSGPVSGSFSTNSNWYGIQNLPAGAYTVTVKDKNNCTVTKTTTIVIGESNLFATLSLVDGSCVSSKVRVSITGGKAPYKIMWSGPQNGNATTNSTTFDISNLPPGTYTVSITDDNWCMVSKTITISPAPGNLFTATPTDGICETPGSIKLNFIGGMPIYNISWTGASSGSATAAGNMFTIENLPAGNYTINVTDSKGCTNSKTVTINIAEGGLTFEWALIVNDCGQFNTIWIDIFGGTKPYVVVWEGPVNGMDTTNTNGYEIEDLPPGKYTVTVKDSNWCFMMEMITIFETPANIFTATANAGSCSQNGSIMLNLTGTPNYQITWSGPQNGSASVGGTNYVIQNVPPGNYTITVSDAKGCVDTKNITLGAGSGNLTAAITGQNGNCTEAGRINVNVTNGAAPFTIILGGAANDTLNLNNAGSVQFTGLSAGNYTVTVRDANGCTITQSLTIVITEDAIGITTSQTSGTCNTAGAILVNISGGSPNYTISWTGGGVMGSAMTSGNAFTINNLPAGNYNITVKDLNNCSATGTVSVHASESNLDVTANVTNGSCGQTGQILVSATGGTGPFNITWTGPMNGSASTNNPTYTISNLPSGTYTIVVTETGGCSQTRTMSVTNSNQQPVSNFGNNIVGSTVTFINQSSPGTYLWTFGDGGTSSANNPTHVYSVNNNYEVCLTVSNACGSKTICRTITVGAPANSVVIDVQDGMGATGSTIYVPVTIENCVASTIVSFAGSLQMQDTSIAKIIGILAGSISPQYFANNRTFSYFSNTGLGVTCGEGQILFYVEVELKGAPGTSTLLNIIGTPLAVELGGMINGSPAAVPYTLRNGQVLVANTAQLAGEITTYWGDGLPDVEVMVSNGAFSEMKMTDETGHYMLPTVPRGSMYTVQPSRNDLPYNGLSTYALFAGQRFILGMEPEEIVSPYQIIAGDANCDGRFTTLDLFLIQRLIIGTSTDFGDCPSWVFVKAGDQMPIEFNALNVFPYQNKDDVMLMKDTVSNFIGVKVGDILGHANPNMLNNSEIRNRNTLYLTAENRSVRAGEVLEIPIRADNFNQIASYQMGWSFDPAKLRFLGLSDNPAFGRIALGAQDAEQGTLRMSWFDLTGDGTNALPNETLFTLRFEVLQDVNDLSKVMQVNSRFIRAEAHTTMAEGMDIALEFPGVLSSSKEELLYRYKLHQNIPNPFQDRTIIGFDLPKDMQADLIIFDQLGKIVRQYSGSYTRGYNQVEVPRQSLSGGVYYYTLRTADFAATKSMIVFE